MGDWADWEIEKMEDYLLDPFQPKESKEMQQLEENYGRHMLLQSSPHMIEPDEYFEVYLIKETSIGNIYSRVKGEENE